MNSREDYEQALVVWLNEVACGEAQYTDAYCWTGKYDPSDQPVMVNTNALLAGMADDERLVDNRVYGPVGFSGMTYAALTQYIRKKRQ